MSNLSSSSPPNLNVQLTNPSQQEQFLMFRLFPEIKAMLPLRYITEVLKIQFGQIVPIPQMSPWVMGVYNWRGDILWMVDLGHLIGCDSWHQNHHHRANYSAIVLSPERQGRNSNNLHLGLIVAQVLDLASCTPGQIQPASSSPLQGQLGDFLHGYWLPEPSSMILSLDAQAIIRAMPRNPQPT